MTDIERKCDYLLRNIPPSLWEKLKGIAQQDGRTLRQTILLALVTWTRQRMKEQEK